MARNQISFFATRADLEPVISAVEGARKLRYVRTGLFDSPSADELDSLLLSPTLGVATVGDAIHEANYLVGDRSMPFQIRDVPQRRGGTKYAIDQLKNPRTISIEPGGVFKDGCLISGQLGTASEDKESLELFKLFSKEITRRFSRVKSYYVGPEARALLEKGWRLTGGVKTPVHYDLGLD